jgi:hypothetical protein
MLFESVPDLVLTFTILRSGQSFCDLVWSWYRIDLRPPRPFGVEIHKLPDPEFVFGHEIPRELTWSRRDSNASQVRSLASMEVRL